jgi:glycosyltransferase EpsD
MKSILYIATSDIHLRTFHVPYLEWLAAQGHTVDLAYEDRGGISFDMARHVYRLDFPRQLHLGRLRRSYRDLKRVIDTGDHDILHCHTPIPSALTRLAARKWRKQGGKVLYTAHGFHFYKGGPIKNWLFYYPAELLLSHLTDCIVTINAEDMACTRHPLWGAESVRIPGIGIQPRGFVSVDATDREALRRDLGFGPTDFILLYVAEFISRKNHRFIIEAAAGLRASMPDLKIVFLGRGVLMDQCRDLADALGVQEHVHFMGFRTDVAQFAQIADVAVSASCHEGLGIALLEQMMCAVPVVATQDRGHREFVEEGRTGFLFAQANRQEFVTKVKALHDDTALRARMGAAAREKAEEFTLAKSMREMKQIYARYL